MDIPISRKRVGYLGVIALLSLCFFINESSFVDAEVGYELLDFNKVLHIWNEEDSYYFNATSGMQFTNHYEEYWSKNVFCAGYYAGWTWNKIICVDELPFTWSIDTDNETYINVTGWRDVTYMGYDVRVALRYHLREWDTRLTIIPYIKNIGSNNIPVDLGFSWHIREINIDTQEENNTFEPYDEEDGLYDFNLSGLNWFNVTGVSDFHIRNTDTSEMILMQWSNLTTSAIRVQPAVGQYNSPITVDIKVGTLAAGQEKKTWFKWIDADPNCGNIGTDGNEDVCFYAFYTTDTWANYSDADWTTALDEFPRFKVSYAAVMPRGCTWTCILYRKEPPAAWGFMDIWTGADCWDNWADGFGKCSNGYCKQHHVRDTTKYVSWDLCIGYSGAKCAVAGQTFCGMGSQGGGSSDRGDWRDNTTLNNHTATAENTTLYYVTDTNFTLDYNFSDLDSGLGDVEGGRSIMWYLNDTYNSTFDNFTSLNYSDLCGGNLTYKMLVWDDSLFSPTGNETYNWSDSSFDLADCAVPVAPAVSYYYRIALIGSYLLIGVILMFLSFKLDHEHFVVKICFFFMSLFLFLTSINTANLLGTDVVWEVYTGFVYLIIFVFAVFIVFFIKNIIPKPKKC